MAKGQEAKAKIANKLAEVFGQDWIGEYDKKYYLWSSESGERIQVCISMTCPKTPIEVATNVDTSGDWNWDESKPAGAVAVAKAAPAEITEEEKQNIADLLTKLGL